MKRAIIINALDNVAMPSEDVKKGDELCYEIDGQSHTLIAKEDIQVYHKLAIRDIKSGEKIIKYGCTIGIAVFDIAEGAHVHTHNIVSDTSGREQA